MQNSLKALRFYLYYIPSMFINNVTEYEVCSSFIFVAGSDPKGHVIKEDVTLLVGI